MRVSQTILPRLYGTARTPLVSNTLRNAPRSYPHPSLQRSFTSTPNLLRAATEPSKPPSAGQFYKTFGRPTLKVFTGAFLTYQLLYLGWMKIENEGIKHDKDLEVKTLEIEVRGLAAERKGKRVLEE